MLILRQRLQSDTANHKLWQYARAFRYLLFSLKEQTDPLGTKQLTTLWLNLGLMRDKWS